MKNILLILIITTLVHLVGCEERISDTHVNVTPFNFLKGADESVIVSFGESEVRFRAFAIKKKDINEGVKLISKSKDNTNFSVFAQIGEQVFIRSESFQTSAQVKVINIDKEHQQAIFEVEASLINFENAEPFKIDKTTIIVEGDNFLLLELD